MKVLIDTNVFLSYLLASGSPRTITTVVRTCLGHDEIELLVPSPQIQELADTVTTKRYFRTRIPQDLIDNGGSRFIQQLTLFAQLPPPLEEIAAYSGRSVRRDEKDDYLVAYGVVNEADYLITGDADLLVLGRIGELNIVNPAQFIAVLQDQNLMP
jgi:putative PIN family toxin of toxin-antitoxin system